MLKWQCSTVLHHFPLRIPHEQEGKSLGVIVRIILATSCIARSNIYIYEALSPAHVSRALAYSVTICSNATVQ